MKKTILLTLGILSIFSHLAVAQTKNKSKAKSLYSEALRLEKEGKVTEALLKLKECMKLMPSSTVVYQKHATLSAKAPGLLYQQKLDALKKITVASIDLEKDSLSSSLKKIMQLITEDNKKNGGNLTTNLVVLDPNKKLVKVSVTLSLKNVPAKVVMDEIMKQAGANYKIEQYAFRIMPNQ